MQSATKGDVEMLAIKTKADVDMLAIKTTADVEMLATTTKAEIEKLELRLIIKIAAIVVGLVGLMRGLEYLIGPWVRQGGG